jgi:hypothetical protein
MRCKMLAESRKRWVKGGAKARRVRRRERKTEAEKTERAEQEAALVGAVLGKKED